MYANMSLECHKVYEIAQGMFGMPPGVVPFGPPGAMGGSNPEAMAGHMPGGFMMFPGPGMPAMGPAQAAMMGQYGFPPQMPGMPMMPPSPMAAGSPSGAHLHLGWNFGPICLLFEPAFMLSHL